MQNEIYFTEQFNIKEENFYFNNQFKLTLQRIKKKGKMANNYTNELSMAEKIRNLNIPIEQQEQPMDLFLHQQLHCEGRKIKRFDQIQCRWCDYPMSNQRKNKLKQAALKVKELIFNEGINHHNINKTNPNKEEEKENENSIRCIICLSVEAKPMYECINGHEICYHCNKKVKICPFCRGDMARFANYENINEIIGNRWIKDEKYKHTQQIQYHNNSNHERIDLFFDTITQDLRHFDRTTWNNRITQRIRPYYIPQNISNPFIPDLDESEFGVPDVRNIGTPTPLTPDRVEIMDENDEEDLPNPWENNIN